jgi:hypothetical protein
MDKNQRTLEGDDLIAAWRSQADENNPAGPLFAGGEFVEADIIGDVTASTCGTGCSGSRTHYCC